MAIYHLHVNVISRGKGRNVVAAAAYRRAAKMRDEREGRTFNYEKKPHVIHSELLLPTYEGTWLEDYLGSQEGHHRSERLWNLIEQSENRIDARLAREIEFALPIELTQEENIKLARSFIQDQFVSRGMICDWSVHWDDGNPHVHALLSLRKVEANGLGKKVREWNAKELVLLWREKWAEHANSHLSLYQKDVQIDHRSYQAQGIDLAPTIHLGSNVIEMERRSFKTDRLRESREIKQLNLQKLGDKPILLLNKIASKQSSFVQNEVTEKVLRYASDKKGLPLDSKQINAIQSKIEHYHAVFSEREIAIALFNEISDPGLFAQAFIQLKSCPELLSLGVGDDGRERFTTKRLFSLENKIIDLVEALSNRLPIAVPSGQLDAKLEYYENKQNKQFTEEQKRAIEYLLKPSMLTCLVGRAGTGKSFSLGFLREIWEGQGVNVHGIALSGIAASQLKKEAGYQAHTIATFLLRAKSDPALIKQNDVIVMDEAGMCDSYAMFEILNLAKRSQAKVVLVGDPQQVQPVGPGATFRAILERAGYAELQTVYRQSAPWQQVATSQLAQGHVKEALQAYEVQGCIHFDSNPMLAISRLVADWFTLHKGEGSQLCNYAVIAHRNQDVALLNAAIREKRIKEGEIDKGYVVPTAKGDLYFSIGDRLLFLANDARLQVKNGQFATVKDSQVDRQGKLKQLTVQLDGTQHYLTVDPSLYADFTHGYAATVHKTQGITVDHTLVYLGGKSWDRHLTYVALSRHQKGCHLYADEATYPSREVLYKRLSRLGLKDSTLEYPYGFAKRRNVKPDKGHLKKHLITRLKEMKAQLIDLFRSRSATHTSEELNPAEIQVGLMKYIEMELTQEANLIALYTIKDPVFKQSVEEKIIQQGEAIRAYANLLRPQAEKMMARKTETLINHSGIGELGGLLAIRNRLKQGRATSQDTRAILLQIRQQAQGYRQSLSHKQQRSRTQ
jgi:ATP-dependent exoDNAse (exonuclease V) alpha subunit